jgi:hypothetical protein
MQEQVLVGRGVSWMMRGCLHVPEAFTARHPQLLLCV